MQTQCISELFGFEGVERPKVIAACHGGAISSEAEALLLRHTDKAIGLFDRVAALPPETGFRMRNVGQ
ncbi:MAG: hypothetical protein GY788_18415 [bacterium]|nr:hypothetical protein [bacterium]